MSLILPVDVTEPHSSVGVQLDGASYVLTLAWNVRDESWYLTVGDADDVPVASGVRVTLGAFLGRHLRYQGRMPPGAFNAVDTSGKGAEAGRDDLGQRVLLTYTPVDEL